MEIKIHNRNNVFILAPENTHWSGNLSNRILVTAQGCGTIRDYKLFLFPTQLIKIDAQK